MVRISECKASSIGRGIFPANKRDDPAVVVCTRETLQILVNYIVPVSLHIS